MSRFVSASEAARRVGVTDKTIRAWIASGKLAAHHIAKNRLAISENDVERLARERQQYASEPRPDVSELQERLTDLERKYQELSEQYQELAARSRPLFEASSTSYAPSYMPTYTPTETRPKRERSAAYALPDGAILARHFASMHDVNPATFKDHYTKGIHHERLIISSRPKPSRTHETEWYITPEDRPRVYEYWRRHGVPFNEPLSESGGEPGEEEERKEDE